MSQPKWAYRACMIVVGIILIAMGFSQENAIDDTASLVVDGSLSFTTGSVAIELWRMEANGNTQWGNSVNTVSLADGVLEIVTVSLSMAQYGCVVYGCTDDHTSWDVRKYVLVAKDGKIVVDKVVEGRRIPEEVTPSRLEFDEPKETEE